MKNLLEFIDSYLPLFLLFFTTLILSIPTFAYLQEIQETDELVESNEKELIQQPSLTQIQKKDETLIDQQEKLLEEESTQTLPQDEQILKDIISSDKVDELKKAKAKNPLIVIQDRIKLLEARGAFSE